MRSHEVLRQAIEPTGVKAIASKLRLSPAMVYKWCQESRLEDPDASGARNPLDRLYEILRATGGTEIVNWLCHEAGGFFVKNPGSIPHDLDAVLLGNTQRLVSQFGQLLLTVTRSVEDDGRIEPREADEIRKAWEQLKTTAETFAVACEAGAYDRDPDA